MKRAGLLYVLLFAACLAAVLVCSPRGFSQQQNESHWYKGDTHTHTLNSDGDSTPMDVVRWYRENGYDFVFVTDHDMVTNVDPLNALFAGGGQFLVLRGEEVTSNSRNPPMHVHVNALSPNAEITQIKEAHTGDVRTTLQANIDAARKAGAIAQINHPNFFWQYTVDDLKSVHGAELFEIMNVQPDVNSEGAGPAAPSAEELWDSLLSRGVTLWGVASDDAHNFKDGPWIQWTDGKWPPARPGGGYIVVRANHLTPGEITAAIRKGDFYASTGVELKDYAADTKHISLTVRTHDVYQEKYRVKFIGKGGHVLQDETGSGATYTIRGDEGYVRARITDSNGRQAWTQPVFVHP